MTGATAAGVAAIHLTRTPHLADLIAETDRLAAAVAASVAAGVEVPAALSADAVAASLALDGTDPDPPMRLERSPSPDARVQALERAGVEAGFAADDLAEQLLADPVATLAQLHGRIVADLVAPDRIGKPRITEQAVHDASIGRVVYYPTAPAGIPAELARLGRWLVAAGAAEPGLIASGVVHFELLRIHPYDAANGRLARAAARLVLRARGLDPAGLAAPEPELAADALGYYEEVASTVRRRDMSVWLERWGEAVTAGLRASARRLGIDLGSVPERAVGFLAGRDRFTVADYRAEVVADPDQVRSDLVALLDAGVVRRVQGARGLRFTTTEPSGPAHT